MTLAFRPSHLSGCMRIPPSKSAAHRHLIAAGLAAGESRIYNLDFSEDISATADCLSAMGALVRPEENHAALFGVGLLDRTGEKVLNCRSSGSTLRFFLSLALLSGKETLLTGTPALLSRPVEPFEELCRRASLRFEKTPEGIFVQGPLRPGEYTIPGGVSSQFATGLLFALPLLSGDSTLRLIPPVESRPYLNLTRRILSEHGISVQQTEENAFHISGGQKYLPGSYTVEGDWTQAALPMISAALGDPVTVSGLPVDSAQGDAALPELMGKLRNGEEVSLAENPDLGPALFVFAALTGGGRFTHTRRLRMKESDRLESMRTGLSAFGIGMEISPDGDSVRILPGTLSAPRKPVDSCDDHRIAMALSLLLCRTGGVLTGAESVSKSWPSFFEQLTALGAEFTRVP